MQLFYTPDLIGDRYTLNEVESKHCIRVLRLQVGSRIHLTNGLGSLFEAEISEANPKACKLNILNEQKEFEKRPYKVHIAIAPTKNIDRFEWFLEKATEIGVDEITPLLCERSERKVIKPERLNKVIVAAMKQSLKTYLPVLNELTRFDDFLQQDFSNLSRKYLCHCNQGQKENLFEGSKAGADTLILIGPEGDFSLQEVDRARKQGFCEGSLGKARLRTETAGVAAVHTIALRNQ